MPEAALAATYTAKAPASPTERCLTDLETTYLNQEPACPLVARSRGIVKQTPTTAAAKSANVSSA